MSGLGISLFRNGWPKRGTIEALWRADWRNQATHLNGLPWPEWFDPALGTLVMQTIRFETGLLSRAPATLVFDTPTSATFGIARWNQIKAAEFHGVDLAQLVVRNIVDAVVSAAEAFSHDRFNVVLEGSKRGMLLGHAERGNDFVLRVDSNGRGDRDNTFLIRGGSGDDTVVVERSLFDWSATGGFRQTYVETWTVVRADLGGGNNRFTSGGSRDHVIVGDGDDIVSTGGGDDTLAVRGGRNVFDGGPGCDTLILRGAFAGYTLALDDLFRFVIEDIDPSDGDDGTTVLVDVEKIVFEGNPGGAFTLRLMPCDNDQARNRRPTAEADAYVIDEDLGVLLVGKGILANDTDPDGDALEAIIVSPRPMQNITLRDAAGQPLKFGGPPFQAFDGTIFIDPAKNWWGDDAFLYIAIDRGLGDRELRSSTAAVVQIVVRPVNDDPEIIPGLQRLTGETFKETPLLFENDFLLAAFFDIDRQRGDGPLDRESNIFDVEADDVLQPANGFVVVFDDGSVAYVPKAGFTGRDTFFVRVTDLKDGQSDWLPVVVTVRDAGPPPGPGEGPEPLRPPGFDFRPVPPREGGPSAMRDGTFVMKEDTTLTLRAETLLANDIVPAGGGRVLAVWDPAALATVHFRAADGRIEVTPQKDYFGDLSLRYTIVDAAGQAATGRIDIMVENVNDAPVAKDDGPFAVTTRAFFSKSSSVFLANDTDVDGDTLRIVGVEAPAGVTVTPYQPDAFSGITAIGFAFDPSVAGKTVTVRYTVSDPDGATATANIVFNVADRPPPVAEDDEIRINQQAGLSSSGLDPRGLAVPAPGSFLFSNDSDAAGGKALVLVDLVPIDAIEVVRDGPGGEPVLFVPNLPGLSRASYTIANADDPDGPTDTATITVIVNGAPRRPPKTVTTNENGFVFLTRGQLLDGVTDPEDDAVDLFTTAQAIALAVEPSIASFLGGRQALRDTLRDGGLVIPGVTGPDDLDPLFCGVFWMGYLGTPGSTAEFGVEVADEHSAVGWYLLRLIRPDAVGPIDKPVVIGDPDAPVGPGGVAMTTPSDVVLFV